MASSPLPFLFWIKHFITDHPGLSSHANNSMNDDFRIFMNNKLQLLDSCSIIPDNSFDDYQAQAKHSATYILWLIKVIVFLLHSPFVMTLLIPATATASANRIDWMLVLLLPASANP
ncbi:hypothetical protein FF1_010663 [Malus domestica]